jgi:ceramide glucosyltransferase
MYIYYFLAVLAIWFGIQSLLGGFRYARYVRRETSRPLENYAPFVSVIAPSRGLEPGLAENLKTLLNQNYPAYEVIFVFDREDDPAAELLRSLSQSDVATKVVIAGPATDSGQKVHNLREAVSHASDKSEVFVFVDTDARPGPDWLRKLVAPLADEDLGASSGYRWFVSKTGGISSSLRSVWNATVASGFGDDRQKNFCWGGSTAIRRTVFEQLKVRDRWRGSVSDDFTITRVIKEAKLPIHFAANCLVASVGDCNFFELCEFTNRQIKITRVYASHLWKGLILGSSLFAIVFFGGSLLLIARIFLGLPFALLASVLAIVFILGAAKGYIRWRVIGIPLKPYRKELRRDLFAHVFLWPFASLLYLYNTIVAGFSRRISWRGITYELKSPTEAVIISRDQ